MRTDRNNESTNTADIADETMSSPTSGHSRSASGFSAHEASDSTEFNDEDIASLIQQPNTHDLTANNSAALVQTNNTLRTVGDISGLLVSNTLNETVAQERDNASRQHRTRVSHSRSAPGLRVGLWITLAILLNAAGVIYSYYVLYASIYVLSPDARRLMSSNLIWSIFSSVGSLLKFVCVGFNTGLLWILAGPVYTRREGQPEVPERRTTPRPQSHATARVVRGMADAVSATVSCAIVIAFAWWPVLWTAPALAILHRKAWNDEQCTSWDYEIVVNTVSYQQLGIAQGNNITILSNATVVTGNTIVALFDIKHPAPNVSILRVHDSSSGNIQFSIHYNFTALNYTESGSSGVFEMEPSLTFPNMSISSLYPSYPWDYACSPPRVALSNFDNRPVMQTSITNYDKPCTMLKVCAMGPMESLAVPFGVMFVEMEKAGRERLNDSDPTFRSNATICSSISPYLYPFDTAIKPNLDISGIGVRLTVYVQSLLNHLAAWYLHDARQAISVNTANAVALSAIALASGYVENPDWPHLIILYHFVLLIYFSNITYSSIPPRLRQSEFFRPLVERLAVLEIFWAPLFIIITCALWIGIMLARSCASKFPDVGCSFGNWVLFGHVVDLGTSPWVYSGLGVGILLVSYYILSVGISTLDRKRTARKAKDCVYLWYGREMPTGQRSLPPDCNAQIRGEYLSAWMWQHAPVHWREGFKIGGFTLSIRSVTFVARAAIWVYLVFETEALIVANNLTDENMWTYGQMFALVLLIIPSTVLWDIGYERIQKFKAFINSYAGHNYIIFTFGMTLGVVYASASYGLCGFTTFGRILLGTVVVAAGAIQYIWASCSLEIDRLFGNLVYLSLKDFWEIVFTHHEIKLPGVDIPMDPVIGRAWEETPESVHPEEEQVE